MSDTVTQLGTLLERSPAASASEAPARAAIERAVSELVDALRNHHSGTADHSNRLAVDCRRVGLELGLPTDFVFELELVAILHDIGKLAVPDTILDLPRPRDGPVAHDPRRRDPHGDRRPAPACPVRAREPRALGRDRLPGPAAGGADPARIADRDHGRRV